MDAMLKMLLALLGGLVGVSLPCVLLAVPFVVGRQIAAQRHTRTSSVGFAVQASKAPAHEVASRVTPQEPELDLDFPDLVVVGDPTGDEEVMLEALAALYGSSHLAIPSMRAQPAWSSAYEAMERIFWGLVAARVTERGFEPGTRLHHELTAAGVMGARTMTRDLARWN